MRYLPSFGWNPTVLTAPLATNDPAVVQTGYVDVATLLKRAVGIRASAHAALGATPAVRGARRTWKQAAIAFGYRLVSYPDAQIGWLFALRSALREALASREFDAILSTSPPFTTDLAIASMAPNIPWIADYRDLWSDSDKYASAMRNVADGRLERWTLRTVTAMTTVSEPLAEVLRSHRRGLPVTVIPNAFDPQEWTNVPFVRSARCTFVHAGQMFNGRRDPSALFRVLRGLVDRGAMREDEVVVELYAVAEPWLIDSIRSHGVERMVEVRGTVSREEVLRAERRADRNLILLWDGRNTKGVLTGKLFEYLGARRRILALGGPVESDIDAILSETGAGIRVRDDGSLEREVIAALEDYRTGAMPTVDEARASAYDALTMSERFASVLNRFAPDGTSARELVAR